MSVEIGKLLEQVQEAARKVQDQQRAIEEERLRLQQEKDAVADQQLKLATIVSVNVGGTRFDTTRATLTACPDSLLAELFSGRHTVVRDANGCVFLDRDPTHFRTILNWLRDYPGGVVPAMSDAARHELLVEAKYYRLPIEVPEVRSEACPTTCLVEVETRIIPPAPAPAPGTTGSRHQVPLTGLLPLLENSQYLW